MSRRRGRRYLKMLRARVTGRDTRPTSRYVCACGQQFSCHHKMAEHEGQTGHRRLTDDQRQEET